MAENASLHPRKGFNPLMVNWGAPDQTRTDNCSYCGDPFPQSDEFVPLIMWNEDGWCAEFCDHCQIMWFGLQSFQEPIEDSRDPTFEDEEAALELGPCCMCGGNGAGNIIVLHRRAPVPGHGWGCVQCDLPTDGAMAVLCTACLIRYQENPDSLTHCCRGYPATDGRIAISELSDGDFNHDMMKHPKDR